MTLVLDACSIIAYLRDEEGADTVEAVFMDDNDCVVHAINLCEVYYDCIRRDGTARADTLIEEFGSLGLVTRDDMDTRLWKSAASFKADLARVSLADCFAMALTHRLHAELVTSDHHEFDPIAARGLCPIRFIR